MNILFWNTAGKSSNTSIASLVAHHKIDVLILAEYKDDEHHLLHTLRAVNGDYKVVPRIGCDRITLFTAYPTHAIKHRKDGERYSIKEIQPSGSIPILLVMVHLLSKLRLSEEDQATRATIIREEIEETEKECGHRNTLVIGDFNMNPFEKGMVSVQAFNSIPCLRANQRESRKIDKREFLFFYNPSWNLLGDRNESAGTYFHRSPSTLSHYWNTLDQAILRPNLAKRILKDSFRTITKSGAIDLVSADSTPAESDHLPITLTINIERAHI